MYISCLLKTKTRLEPKHEIEPSIQTLVAVQSYKVTYIKMKRSKLIVNHCFEIIFKQTAKPDFSHRTRVHCVLKNKFAYSK